MPKDERIRVLHMRDAARKILEFCRGASRETLETDEKLQLAVVRLLEILGEAAKKVPLELKQKYPTIPWQEIAAVRDRLAHGYFAVDLDIVWNIVRVDLPPVCKELERIIAEES